MREAIRLKGVREHTIHDVLKGRGLVFEVDETQYLRRFLIGDIVSHRGEEYVVKAIIFSKGRVGLKVRKWTARDRQEADRQPPPPKPEKKPEKKAPVDREMF